MHSVKDSDTEKVQPLVSILTKKALYDWSLNAVNGVIRGQEASVVVLWSMPQNVLLSSLTLRKNKLECLSLASLFSSALGANDIKLYLSIIYVFS